MKVIDITYSDLNAFYKLLIEKRFSNIPKFAQIAIVGIANSGVNLSEGISKQLIAIGYEHIQTCTVLCKRPSSSITDSAANLYESFPLRMPKFISNFLRTVEHHLLGKIRPPSRIVTFQDQCDEKIAKSDFILIIDDAVDSGYSMKAVYENILQRLPNAVITSAAYVITQKKPVIEPDFFQHRDVIVRFPWAVDRQ